MMGWTVASMRKARNAYRMLVGKHLGFSKMSLPLPLPLGRLRCEETFKMDLKEVACDDGRWMELAQDCV
jgi:hypothetical protein